MEARPVLVVELPVPAGREEEWNRWYHDIHIPDVLRSVDGVVRSCRYRLIGGEDEFRYLVCHEFDSVETLQAYHASTLVAERWEDYETRWGLPAGYRRRAFEPVFELDARS